MGYLTTLAGFSRPHTVIATSVQTLTIFLVAGGWRHLGPATALLLAATLAACLAANIYVVGLNQITDIAIDRVNKPGLPLAAGTLSVTAARRIVAAAAALSLATAAALAPAAGPALLITVAVVMLVGTAYSLPPLRLKGRAAWAMLSIAGTRGLLANMGLALHYGAALGEPLPLATLAMIAVFFFGFTTVIAIYKDLPDLAGDRMHRIQTLTVRLGPERVVAVGRVILGLCYMLPLAVALAGLPGAASVFLLVTHIPLLGAFWAASRRVDPARQASASAFYMLLWRMFYGELVLLSIYEIARSVA